MTEKHHDKKTFLLKAYLLEVEVINTKIVMAIIGAKVRYNTKLKLEDLEYWRPNKTNGWDDIYWKKLCGEIIRIKMLNAIKQESV